jgi:hypothetical protein
MACDCPMSLRERGEHSVACPDVVICPACRVEAPDLRFAPACSSSCREIWDAQQRLEQLRRAS